MARGLLDLQRPDDKHSKEIRNFNLFVCLFVFLLSYCFICFVYFFVFICVVFVLWCCLLLLCFVVLFLVVLFCCCWLLLLLFVVFVVFFFHFCISTKIHHDKDCCFKDVLPVLKFHSSKLFNLHLYTS